MPQVGLQYGGACRCGVALGVSRQVATCRVPTSSFKRCPVSYKRGVVISHKTYIYERSYSKASTVIFKTMI